MLARYCERRVIVTESNRHFHVFSCIYGFVGTVYSPGHTILVFGCRTQSVLSICKWMVTSNYFHVSAQFPQASLGTGVECSFPCIEQIRNQHRSQNPDDRDNDQQLNEGKTLVLLVLAHL